MTPTNKKATKIEDMISWANRMSEKGIYHKASVINMVRAIRNVESILEEDEKDMESLLKNLDGIIARWATKTNAAPKSVQPTKSHAKRLIEDYFAYLANPGSFRAGRGRDQTKGPAGTKPAIAKPPKKVSMARKTTSHIMASEFPDININIQINIPPDAPESQIDKIFESMAKHIYRKTGE